jgi:hypothetical protein
MAFAATVYTLTSRDQILWDKELARVRAECDTMSPAVTDAVQSVLRSVATERTYDGEIAASALALLDDLVKRPA